MTWYLVGSNLPRQRVPGMERSLEITTLMDPVENVQNMRSHSSILFEVLCNGAVPWRILGLQNFPTFTLMIYFLWPSGVERFPEFNQSQDSNGTYHVYRVTTEKLELCLTCMYPMQLRVPQSGYILRGGSNEISAQTRNVGPLKYTLPTIHRERT